MGHVHTGAFCQRGSNFPDRARHMDGAQKGEDSGHARLSIASVTKQRMKEEEAKNEER